MQAPVQQPTCSDINAAQLKQFENAVIHATRLSSFKFVKSDVILDALTVGEIMVLKDQPIDPQQPPSVTMVCVDGHHSTNFSYAIETSHYSLPHGGIFDRATAAGEGSPPPPNNYTEFLICKPETNINPSIHTISAGFADSAPVILHRTLVEALPKIISNPGLVGPQGFVAHVDQVITGINMAVEVGRKDFTRKLNEVVEKCENLNGEKVFPPEYQTISGNIKEGAACIMQAQTMNRLRVTGVGGGGDDDLKIAANSLGYVSSDDKYGNLSSNTRENAEKQQRFNRDAFNILVRIELTNIPNKVGTTSTRIITLFMDRNKILSQLASMQNMTDGINFKIKYFIHHLRAALSDGSFFKEKLPGLIKEYDRDAGKRVELAEEALLALRTRLKRKKMDKVLPVSDIDNNPEVLVASASLLFAENIHKSVENVQNTLPLVEWFCRQEEVDSKILFMAIGCQEEYGLIVMKPDGTFDEKPIVFHDVLSHNGFFDEFNIPTLFCRDEKGEKGRVSVLKYGYEIETIETDGRVSDDVLRVGMGFSQESEATFGNSLPNLEDVAEIDSFKPHLDGPTLVNPPPLYNGPTILPKLEIVEEKPLPKKDASAASAASADAAELITEVADIQSSLSSNHNDVPSKPESKYRSVASKVINLFNGLLNNCSIWSLVASVSDRKEGKVKRRDSVAEEDPYVTLKKRAFGGGSRQVSRKHAASKKRRSTYIARCTFRRKNTYRGVTRRRRRCRCRRRRSRSRKN